MYPIVFDPVYTQLVVSDDFSTYVLWLVCLFVLALYERQSMRCACRLSFAFAAVCVGSY